MILGLGLSLSTGTLFQEGWVLLCSGSDGAKQQGAMTAVSHMGLGPAGLLLAGAGCLHPLRCAQPVAGSAFPQPWPPSLPLAPRSHHGFPHSIPCCWSKGLPALPSPSPPGPGGSVLPLSSSLGCVPAWDPPGRRLNEANLLHELPTSSPPVSTRLLAHHRLCKGDPGLLSTVQLMTVVVHQLGVGIRPLCPCLGCSASGTGTRCLSPPHGHRNLPQQEPGLLLHLVFCFGAK